MIGTYTPVVAERTALPAKGGAEDIMAIAPQHLCATEACDPFGFGIEKKDATIKIVGNNALFEAVQNPDQIFAAGNIRYGVSIGHLS